MVAEHGSGSRPWNQFVMATAMDLGALCIGTHLMCHSSVIFFHPSFVSIFDSLKFFHHHPLISLRRFLDSLIHSVSCTYLIFSGCDLAWLILTKAYRAGISLHSIELIASQFLRNSILCFQLLSVHSQANVFVLSRSIQCIGFRLPQAKRHLIAKLYDS